MDGIRGAAEGVRKVRGRGMIREREEKEEWKRAEKGTS